MDGGPVIKIHVAFRNGIRWPLRDTDAVEVWRGLEHLGSLSGETVRHLIQHHMADFELRQTITNELSGRTPVVSFQPLRKALLLPFTSEQREAFRARRKAKKR